MSREDIKKANASLDLEQQCDKAEESQKTETRSEHSDEDTSIGSLSISESDSSSEPIPDSKSLTTTKHNPLFSERFLDLDYYSDDENDGAFIDEEDDDCFQTTSSPDFSVNHPQIQVQLDANGLPKKQRRHTI
jgi:hypothetical protein